MSHDGRGMQIFLVGTAHVSRNSAEEVRELIKVVRPSTIMVELCQKRADKLRSSPKVSFSSRSLLHVVLPHLQWTGQICAAKQPKLPMKTLS